MVKNPDRILSRSSKITRRRNLGGPRNRGNRMRMMVGEFKELTKNGTDASLMR
jgi:hypothetical protein